MEQFWINLCFETTEHSVLTAEDNNKVPSHSFVAESRLYGKK